MKKTIAILLTAVLLITLAACSTNGGSSSSGNGSPESSVALLEKVWSNYADDEKFAAAGGDSSEANAKSDAPGVFSTEDPALLDSMLGFPESSADKIDGAASLMHMMNQNTFTCGVFHVKASGDVSAVAEELKANILARRWMCGFPEKLIIYSVGDYIVSYFGEGQIISLFTEKLTSAYASAQLISETPIE